MTSASDAGHAEVTPPAPAAGRTASDASLVDNGSTATTNSPAMSRRSRLVLRIVTDGIDPMIPTISATASTRCSQLSRTSASGRPTRRPGRRP